MRFTTLQLLLATSSSLLPLATSLQSIYLATLSQASSAHYLAFFTDSDPCTTGTVFGFTLVGFHNCDERLSILGHDNITFTGCPPDPAYGFTFPGTFPTGVADDGAPALTCVPAQDPPDVGPYGAFAFCPYIEGNDEVNVGSVDLKEVCS